MNLFRRSIGTLSRSQTARRAMVRWPVARAVAQRFVAGEETSSAVAAVQTICQNGFCATPWCLKSICPRNLIGASDKNARETGPVRRP